MYFKYLIWISRYTLYRFIYGFSGEIDSHIGAPVFHMNLRNRIKVNGSFGMFPNWRIEFHDTGKIMANGKVRIGQNFHCIVGANIYLGDGVTIAPDVYISTYETKLRSPQKRIVDREIRVAQVIIKDNVFIGRGAMIMPGVTIGEAAVVGANAIVKSDVNPGEVIT